MQYVALLRGVNVGGRSIKMTELKALFEDLGFQDVQTILQSGNVVFCDTRSASTLKKIIESALSKKFHYPAKVQVYSLSSIKSIVADSPFSSTNEYHAYVIFFENGLEEQLMQEADNLDAQVEKVQAGNGVIYWQVPKGLTLTSSFAKYLVKATYKNYLTNRNSTTLQKIIKLERP
jgi:uncharacterized protein (DUF1697 family)